MRVLFMLVFLLAMCAPVLAQDGHRVVTFEDGRDASRFAVYRTDVPTDYVWYVPFGTLSAKIKNDVVLFRNVGGDPFGGVIYPNGEGSILVEYYSGIKEEHPMGGSNIGALYKYTLDDFWYR